jgi:hypothetical protein
MQNYFPSKKEQDGITNTLIKVLMELETTPTIDIYVPDDIIYITKTLDCRFVIKTESGKIIINGKPVDTEDGIPFTGIEQIITILAEYQGYQPVLLVDLKTGTENIEIFKNKVYQAIMEGVKLLRQSPYLSDKYPILTIYDKELIHITKTHDELYHFKTESGFVNFMFGENEDVFENIHSVLKNFNNVELIEFYDSPGNKQILYRDTPSSGFGKKRISNINLDKDIKYLLSL